MNMKATILRENGKCRYFDKNGIELKEGDFVKFPDGKSKELYLTDGGELGVDATNPLWIQTGRAIPCEYGIYPLEWEEMSQIEKLNNPM